MKQYHVKEAFDILKKYKITSHQESVRRWLRNGTIKGIQPINKKEGWVIREKDLFDFIHTRLPDHMNAINDVNMATNNEEIRAKMWWELVSRNIFEGYIEPRRKQIKECCEHKGYSKEFEQDIWQQISVHTRGYRTPRIPYLLDAFLFQEKRVLMDQHYGLKEERILFALIEHLRQKRIQ